MSLVLIPIFSKHIGFMILGDNISIVSISENPEWIYFNLECL